MSRAVWRRFHVRRWMVPVAVVVLLFTTTVVAWAVNHVSASDPDFLEPGSAAPVGSRELAGRLAAGNVTVDRVGDSPRAVDTARAGGTTVLVTAPDFVRPGMLGALLSLPVGDRVVLVDPSPAVLDAQGLPVRRTGSRFTTGVRGSGCPLPGPAATLGSAYAVDGGSRCFDGGLVRLPGVGRPEVLVVGAADVFRNDRQAEHRNAALAGALVGDHARLVWLSLHRPETEPEPTGQVPPPPPAPTEDRPTGTASPSSEPFPSGSAGGGGDQRADSNSPPNPLWAAFPPWVWAIVAQALLAAVLFALWRARRLGTPVAEPLPVVVPAAETVRGRARLYHRAHARGVALAALRTGALRRLAPLLDGVGPDDRMATVARLAEGSGWETERVWAVLYGPEPETDDELRTAVDDLDELVRRVQERY